MTVALARELVPDLSRGCPVRGRWFGGESSTIHVLDADEDTRTLRASGLPDLRAGAGRGRARYMGQCLFVGLATECGDGQRARGHAPSADIGQSINRRGFEGGETRERVGAGRGRADESRQP